MLQAQLHEAMEHVVRRDLRDGGEGTRLQQPVLQRLQMGSEEPKLQITLPCVSSLQL